MAAVLHLTDVDDPPNKRAIAQGATFEMTIVQSGDYSTWVARGQIRDNYASEGGLLKASFSFDTLVYGSLTLPSGSSITGTIIRPTLGSSITSTLNWLGMKRRQYARDIARPGINTWVYDLELQSPEGKVFRLCQGFVEISEEVTQ